MQAQGSINSMSSHPKYSAARVNISIKKMENFAPIFGSVSLEVRLCTFLYSLEFYINLHHLIRKERGGAPG